MDDEEQNFVQLNTKSDFVNGQWIEDEFVYESVRKKRKLTKDDHILGIFNDTLEEFEDNVTSSVDISTPLNFVRGGTLDKPTKLKEKNVKKNKVEKKGISNYDKNKKQEQEKKWYENNIGYKLLKKNEV